MKLATRTFLWLLIPFTLVLGVSFWALQARVLLRVHEELESSVKQTQATLANVQKRASADNRRVLRVAAENSTLKAGVQEVLFDRISPGTQQDLEARRTLEQQLVEIGGELDFDFLLVADGNRVPLAAVMIESGKLEPLDLARDQPPSDGYFTSSGRTYQVTSVPINEGGNDEHSENLGWLSVGERFDLSNLPGRVVLLRNGRVIETNSPGLPVPDAEASLRNCPANAECEIQMRGETYVSAPLQSDAASGGYSLRSLESVDAVAGPVQSILRRVFILAGLGALVVAVIVSGLSSRSIVRPIASVINRLHESAATGELPEFDSGKERIHEIRELAESFNRAASAVREGQERLRQANVQFIESLASALDARDPYTAGHSRRVSEFACAAAEALGLSPAQMHEIRIGALLHDIGKIGIADAILQKPGRLTADEEEIIRQHPSIGRKILEGVAGFQAYLNVVELHHENWDGTGYPRRLRADETPLTARVVKIADAWDAMTSDRPYRRGLSRAKALDILRNVAGTQTDPIVTEVFCKLWDAAAAAEESADASLAHLARAVGSETRVPAQQEAS